MRQIPHASFWVCGAGTLSRSHNVAMEQSQMIASQRLSSAMDEAERHC